MAGANIVPDEECVNRKRLQVVVLRIAMLACALFTSAPTGLLAQTVTIDVRVLNGRTGKSLPGMDLRFVDYHSDGNGSIHDDLSGRMAVKTLVDGDSYIANPDARGVLVFGGLGNDAAWVACTRQKFYDSDTRTYGNEYLYPVSAIVASGLVAKNSCSKITTTAKPSELVIFIRPTTWWERFIWGMRS